MTAGFETRPQELGGQVGVAGAAPRARRVGLAAAVTAGILLAVAAGIALWASEGASVFANAAFGALAACL